MTRDRLWLGLGLVCLGFFAACGESRDETRGQQPLAPRARSRANAAFVAQLDALDYFKRLDPEQALRRKEAFLREGWSAIFSGPPHRLNPADAEDLAQGGIGDFIRLVRPFLVAEKVKVPEIRDEVGTTGYTVRVGEKTYPIYSREELQRDKSDEPGLIWGLSMVRGFAIIDELLAGAKSKERIYAVDGGNDLFGIFLTPELYQLILKHPDASPSEAPYEPKEEHPHFGQPEWHDWHEGTAKPD